MRIRYDFAFHSLALIGPFVQQKIRILLSIVSRWISRWISPSSRIDIPSFSDKFSTSPFRVSTSYPIVHSLSSPLLFFFFSFYHDNWTILTKTCNNVQIIVVVARAGEIFFDFTLSFHSPLSDISRSASCTPLSSIISFYRSRDKFYTSIFTRKFLFPRDLLLFLSQCSILHGLAGIFNAV